jgi:DNA mismatch repair ATPase MutL
MQIPVRRNFALETLKKTEMGIKSMIQTMALGNPKITFKAKFQIIGPICIEKRGDLVSRFTTIYGNDRMVDPIMIDTSHCEYRVVGAYCSTPFGKKSIHKLCILFVNS